jgi:N-acetylglucosamine malate deacetylase 1
MQTLFGTPQPLELLTLAPHPDDAEIGTGGTLIKAAQNGRAVGILELTAGEMGTLGTPEIRLQETCDAAKIMGLAFRGNLHLEDGRLGQEEGQALELAAALRVLRPQTLLMPHFQDRHPDHIGSYHLGKRALHLAGLTKAALEGKPFKVPRTLLYQGNAPIEAQVLVDVTDQQEVWEQCVMAHHSQFTGGYISETVTPQILERRKARMMYWGTFIGVQYAEAYSSEGPLLLEL